MKLYIWKHKDTCMRPENFYPLSKGEKVGKNGYYAHAVHAFFKRKDAIKHLEEIGWDDDIKEYYELITVTL